MIGEIIGGVTRGIGLIFGSAEQREKNQHAQTMAGTALDTATLGQFVREFDGDRSWWGSFVNGLNRLPRPAMALGLLWVIFGWPLADMASFVEFCTALAVVPEGFWLLFATVAAFYFGGRMQIKAQSFRMTRAQAGLARQLTAPPAKPWINPDTGKPMGVV